MSADIVDVHQSRTHERFTIMYADGTVKMAGQDPWWTSSRNAANNEIFESRNAMRESRIPEKVWPRVVTIKQTTTWHGIEEVEES